MREEGARFACRAIPPRHECRGLSRRTMTDKLLTYRYPRTLAEAASRYPCNAKDAIAVHGPYRRPLVADNWIAGLIVVASLAGLAVGIVRGVA